MSNKRNTKETVVTRVCTVSGLTRPTTDFYKGQNHLKAIDNLRRNSGVTKDQMRRMFNNLQLNN
jgi:adenylate kinase family enzyme